MNALVCLTPTDGIWVGRNEVDVDPAKGVRGVNSDVGYHDGSGRRGRGRGIDVLHSGVHPVLPVYGHHYEVNSITAGDVIGADERWTAACRMSACSIKFKDFISISQCTMHI